MIVVQGWKILRLQNENKPKYFGIGNYNEEGFAFMEKGVGIVRDTFRKALKHKNLKIVFGTDATAGAHGHDYEEFIVRVKDGGQDPWPRSSQQPRFPHGRYVDWPIEWAELEKYYCEAERRLGVSGEPTPFPGGYTWSPHLLLLSSCTRFPNGLANKTGQVGKYTTGHTFISSTIELNADILPGENPQYGLISRQFFRCAPDKPYVRHDLRIWANERSLRASKIRTVASYWATISRQIGVRATSEAWPAFAAITTFTPLRTASSRSTQRIAINTVIRCRTSCIYRTRRRNPRFRRQSNI
ncbi:MAG TPA: hypothetical protein VH302_05210 [Bryobacteraceae bacterium]|nr:hypothetical protein [Bryobacteraceae bacterium]